MTTIERRADDVPYCEICVDGPEALSRYPVYECIEDPDTQVRMTLCAVDLMAWHMDVRHDRGAPPPIVLQVTV